MATRMFPGDDWSEYTYIGSMRADVSHPIATCPLLTSLQCLPRPKHKGEVSYEARGGSRRVQQPLPLRTL